MKRIAIVTGKNPNTKMGMDGGSVLVKEMARAFLNRHMEVDIFVPSGYMGSKKLETEKSAGCREIFSLGNGTGANIVKFECPQVHVPQYRDSSLEFINRIAISYCEADYFRDLKLLDHDAVFITHMAHTFGIVLNDMVPLERTIVMPMLLGRFYQEYMPIAPSYIDLEREVLGRVIHVQSPSNAEKKVLVEYYGVREENVFVSARGFNPAIITAKKRENPSNCIKPNILCANAVRNQKNQHVFVGVVEELKKRGFEPVVHIAGLNGDTHSKTYNEYAQKLRGMIEEKGLAGNFLFHKAMFQDKLDKLMQSCDIAVYPSKTETFGKSALEAIVGGIPTVVVETVEAFREFIEHEKTGLIVGGGAVEIAGAVERLMKQNGFYASLSRNGISMRGKYFWDVVMDRMLGQIKERFGWGE